MRSKQIFTYRFLPSISFLRSMLLAVAFAVICPAAFVAAQGCPQSIDSFELVKSTYATWTVNRLDCGTDYGGKSCFLVCAYYIPNRAPDAQISFYTRAIWYTQSPPRPYYSEICNANPPANDLNSVSKQIWIHLGDVKHDVSSAAAQKVAQQLFQMAEPQAAQCPAPAPSGDGPRGQPRNADACTANFQKLQNLLATSSELNGQIEYLRDYKRKEQWFRNNLSYLNKLVAALNTSNYDGDMRDMVNTLRESREDRESFARSVGLDPDLDALTLARAARDLTIAKIEYIVDAPGFLGRLNDQKVFLEAEIFKLRSKMSLQECGGNFDGSSCDLTGNWTFNFSEGVTESWTFSPAGPGRYSAVKNYLTGPAVMKAEAEVFGKEVVLRFGEGDATINIAGSYRFQLYEGCNSGQGEGRLTGRPDKTHSFVPRRVASTARTFIPDKMYEIVYLGKLYPAVYSRQIIEGVPIDLFYFKILETNGDHARQDGEELWGRFVRSPAQDQSDQLNVQTWIVNWVRSGGRWAIDERRGVVFTVR